MSAADYALWDSGKLTVAYPVPLFHEIDFGVNEGFRRIPHGGIETGGLLFGTFEAPTIRVQAFRPIDCEHAFGPSFKLSDRDVTRIGEQIETAPTDPELSGLVPLGWFIAHTRSELILNDHEAALFDQLFPQLGALTILVKPEKFKPTRFAFLLRETNGMVSRDGTQSSMILPLPGRAARAPKLPVDTVAAPLPQEPLPEELKPAERNSEQKLAEAEPFRISSERENVPEPVSPPRHQPMPTKPEAIEFPRPLQIETASSAVSFGQASVAGEPSVYERARQRQQARQAESAAITPAAWGTLHWVLFTLTTICFGVAAYGTYLRVQPVFIPVTVTPVSSGLALSWPSSFTRDADDVTVRVNNGTAFALPSADRLAGTSLVTTNKAEGVTVELSVHRWLRNARGIVHYVILPAISTPRLASAPPARQSAVPRHSTTPPPPVFPPIGSEGLAQPKPQPK